jgi:hypothetical protein
MVQFIKNTPGWQHHEWLQVLDAAAALPSARFRNSKAVGAVFGLTPAKYQSGEIDRRGCSRGVSRRTWERNGQTVNGLALALLLWASRCLATFIAQHQHALGCCGRC